LQSRKVAQIVVKQLINEPRATKAHIALCSGSPLGGLPSSTAVSYFTVHIHSMSFNWWRTPSARLRATPAAFVTTENSACWANILGTEAKSSQSYEIKKHPIPIISYVTFMHWQLKWTPQIYYYY